MKKLLYSPVLAAVILSLGLITSAFILSRAKNPSQGRTTTLSDQNIRSQFITQMTEQAGDSTYKDSSGKEHKLDKIVVTKLQWSPKHNLVDIDCRFEWQNTNENVSTYMSLKEDKFGRYDSGVCFGILPNKSFRVIVQ